MNALVVLAMGLLLADDRGPDVATETKKGLEGTWTITSVVRNENPLPDDRLKNARFLFRGERFVQELGERTLAKGTFHLDSESDPQTIDLTMSQGEDKGKTILGIFRRDGDVLTICGAGPGGERPTEFAARDGSGHTLITCQRVKP